jgi:hypothetical protein
MSRVTVNIPIDKLLDMLPIDKIQGAIRTDAQPLAVRLIDQRLN